jgi:pheromone a factor receptor
MTIYTLAKRERQFSAILSSNRNLNRNRYIRLMALSSIEILGTIPIGTYIVVLNAKAHVNPWHSWAQTHGDHHYSHIFQVPASFWRNDLTYKNSLEMFRWLMVACALIFFAFFGFADEARQHYRLAFKSLASRIGYSTSSSTLHGSSLATSSLPYMKSKGGVKVSVVTSSGNKRDSIDSFTDQLSIPSISLASDLKPDLKIEQFSPTNSTASSSVCGFEQEIRRPSPEPATLPAVPPASVPPHFPDSIKPTIRAYSIEAADAV